MNILYYDLLRGKIEGAESTHIRETVSNLIKIGHNVLFYRLNDKSLKRNKSGFANAKVSLWRLGQSWPLLGLFIWFVSDCLTFKRVLSGLKHEDKPEIVYYRDSLFNLELRLANHLKVPAVKEVNGINYAEMCVRWPVRGYIALKIVNYIEKVNIPKADKIVVVTPKLKDILIAEYEVPENKIVVIENGANTELFRLLDRETALRQLKLDEKCRYIGFVGSFTPWHGIEYLVKSAPLILKEFREVKFLLVGDGVMKEKIKGMVEELNLRSSFIFINKIPYEDVYVYINTFDICIILKEKDVPGSPLKLWEYMACGKPVIASNTQEFKALEDYNAGILVNPENPVELADAIITLLNNAELREQKGKNGRKYVFENRSWETVAIKISQVCKETTK